MPSVPIVMPSEIATVLNSIGVPPAARTPSLTLSARRRRWKLQGIVSVQVLAMPTIGRCSASSSKPMPFRYARAGARSGPSRMTRLRLRRSPLTALPRGQLAAPLAAALPLREAPEVAPHARRVELAARRGACWRAGSRGPRRRSAPSTWPARRPRRAAGAGPPLAAQVGELDAVLAEQPPGLGHVGHDRLVRVDQVGVGAAAAGAVGRPRRAWRPATRMKPRSRYIPHSSSFTQERSSSRARCSARRSRPGSYRRQLVEPVAPRRPARRGARASAGRHAARAAGRRAPRDQREGEQGEQHRAGSAAGGAREEDHALGAGGDVA